MQVKCLILILIMAAANASSLRESTLIKLLRSAEKKNAKSVAASNAESVAGSNCILGLGHCHIPHVHLQQAVDDVSGVINEVAGTIADGADTIIVAAGEIAEDVGGAIVDGLEWLGDQLVKDIVFAIDASDDCTKKFDVSTDTAATGSYLGNGLIEFTSNTTRTSADSAVSRIYQVLSTNELKTHEEQSSRGSAQFSQEIIEVATEDGTTASCEVTVTIGLGVKDSSLIIGITSGIELNLKPTVTFTVSTNCNYNFEVERNIEITFINGGAQTGFSEGAITAAFKAGFNAGLQGEATFEVSADISIQSAKLQDSTASINPPKVTTNTTIGTEATVEISLGVEMSLLNGAASLGASAGVTSTGGLLLCPGGGATVSGDFNGVVEIEFGAGFPEISLPSVSLCGDGFSFGLPPLPSASESFTILDIALTAGGDINQYCGAGGTTTQPANSEVKSSAGYQLKASNADCCRHNGANVGSLAGGLAPNAADCEAPCSAIGGWKRTANAALSGYNNIRKVGSVDDCKAACIANPTCKSFDYHKRKNKCDISYSAASKNGVPALKTTYSGNPYDHYALTRDCAFFSHSKTWKNCAFCSECELSYGGNSGKYTSWSKKGRNIRETGVNGVGGWGGTCTCPDGTVYQVGDMNNYCGSLACFGGVSGACSSSNPGGGGVKVTCAPM